MLNPGVGVATHLKRQAVMVAIDMLLNCLILLGHHAVVALRAPNGLMDVNVARRTSAHHFRFRMGVSRLGEAYSRYQRERRRRRKQSFQHLVISIELLMSRFMGSHCIRTDANPISSGSREKPGSTSGAGASANVMKHVLNGAK